MPEPEVPSELQDSMHTAASQGLLGWVGRQVGPSGPVMLPVRAMRPAFKALEHRDYRLVWFGALLSNIGAWVQNVAKSWLVYDLSGSAVWLGIDAMAQHLPTVLLLPLGGVLADRMDRKRLLIACNASLAVLAVVLAALIWTNTLVVWHIVLVSALSGMVQAGMVPANQSLLPALVGRKDLTNAVALNAMQFNLSRVIGPAIGGIMLVVVGAGWSFSLNALTFMALIIALLMIHPPRLNGPATESVLASLVGGMRYLRNRSDLMIFLILILMTSLCVAPVMTMLPALVAAVYEMDASAFSILLSAFGVGAVIGAMMLAARSTRGVKPWRAIPVLMVGGVCILLASLGSFVLAVLAVAGVGMCMIGALNRLNAALLSSIRDAMRGRMSSYFVLCFRIGIALGSLAAGVLATWVGVGQVFVLYGALLVLGVLGVWIIVRTRSIQYRIDPEM